LLNKLQSGLAVIKQKSSSDTTARQKKMKSENFDSFDLFMVDFDDNASVNLTPSKRVLQADDDTDDQKKICNPVNAQMTCDEQRKYIEFLKSMIDEKNTIIQFQRQKILELRKELIEQQLLSNKNI
jgi:hypothetical protein